MFTEISGGEQQLTMIARVLTQEPKLILLDEPTNHLDYGNQYRMVDIMKQLAEAELTPERLSELYGIPIGVMDSAEAGRRLCYTKNAGGNL